MFRKLRDKLSLQNGPQSGFITMIVVIILILAAVIFVAYKRVLDVQH